MTPHELLVYVAAGLAGLGVAAIGLSLPSIGALLSGVWPYNEFIDRSDHTGLRWVGGVLISAGAVAGALTLVV